MDSQLDYADEDSPFPEVRASVSNIDDPSIPANTFRVWFLGFILLLAATYVAAFRHLCCINHPSHRAANCYFMFRYPSASFTPQILVLLAHPMGKVCAMVLPYTTYKLPRWLGGMTFSFNPGPWNVKEHTLLYIMASIASMPPYITYMFVVQESYYGIKNGVWYEILMVLSCDLTGFGLAGFCRGLTVKSASMIWPQNLVTCALMNTLHAEEEKETGGTSRPRFFGYILLGAFVFYFFPGMRTYLYEMTVNSLFVFRRFHIYRSVDVLLGMLDLAKERAGQPIIWGNQRTGDGASDLRLGTNFVGWESTDDPLVDTRKRVCQLRCDPVDHRPDHLLYQCQQSRTPPLTAPY